MVIFKRIRRSSGGKGKGKDGLLVSGFGLGK